MSRDENFVPGRLDGGSGFRSGPDGPYEYEIAVSAKEDQWRRPGDHRRSYQRLFYVVDYDVGPIIEVPSPEGPLLRVDAREFVQHLQGILDDIAANRAQQRVDDESGEPPEPVE